jgi:hypothetical protein
MRKLLLVLLAALPFAANAQMVADFETPALPKPDTFFMRYDLPHQDIGINSGFAHFPLYADTLSGYQSWYGFTYSNMTDSISSGQGNQYSARPGIGANGSSQYAVAYGDSNKVILTGAAQGKPVRGFYITNSSYTWNSIKYGDGFSRRFAYPDFFRITVQGYRGGALAPDTVQFYLADYRFTDTTKAYAVKDWQWVNLLKLGGVDSLLFTFQSSDTSSFGGVTYINKPLYMCMDNFTTNDGVGVPSGNTPIIAKVFPNPAQEVLHIELRGDAEIASIMLYDMAGGIVRGKAVSGKETLIDMHALPAGNYLLRLQGKNGQIATQGIIKQ